MAARTGRSIEDWLGPALDDMTEDQVERLALVGRKYLALPDRDGDAWDTVLTGALKYILGELNLTALGKAYRRARLAVEQETLGAVLAGMPEAEAARQSTLDRMTVRRMQGKR